MKKIMTICMLAMITLASCAQDSVKATQMTQSELQKALNPLMEKLSQIPEDGNEDAAMKAATLEFVKENRNDAGVYAITRILSYVMDTDELIKFIESDDYFKADPTIVKSRETWNIQLETAEGKMFRDFSAEYEGKTTKLSDYVGKGKYVLVDFWASWCGPCKKEIPNLIKVYEKYKGDKFEVLGVATWDKPEDTKKSIESLGIPYPQMLNAQRAGSDAYGIEGIPEIILFAPDGKIVKRGLRGEAIEAKIAEVLK